MELINYFIAMVSLYCYDCVVTNIVIIEGYWMIGDPASNSGGVGTVEGNLQTWPHQVTGWEYVKDGKWIADDQLTVTGDINIMISTIILIISTIEGRPEYPESLTIKDETGDSPQLEGVYRRQGDSLVWKYGDYEISYDGKYYLLTVQFMNIIISS